MKLRFLLVTAFCLVTSVATAQADILWESDYATAVGKSRATGKPLFIDVYTDWCGWCKRLDSDVYPDSRIRQMASQYIMLKLNADGSGATQARAFQVRGYPTLIFASSTGMQIQRIQGYLEANDFVGVMSQALGTNAQLKSASPAQAAKVKMPVSITPKVVRMSFAAGANNWKNQPELRKATANTNYGGAFLLGDSGVVAIEGHAKKKATSSKKLGKTTKLTTKAARKRLAKQKGP